MTPGWVGGDGRTRGMTEKKENVGEESDNPVRTSSWSSVSSCGAHRPLQPPLRQRGAAEMSFLKGQARLVLVVHRLTSSPSP